MHNHKHRFTKQILSLIIAGILLSIPAILMSMNIKNDLIEWMSYGLGAIMTIVSAFNSRQCCSCA